MNYWNIFEYSTLMQILENIWIKNIGAIIGEHLDVRKMAPTLGNICICKTVVKYSKLALAFENTSDYEIFKWTNVAATLGSIGSCRVDREYMWIPCRVVPQVYQPDSRCSRDQSAAPHSYPQVSLFLFVQYLLYYHRWTRLLIRQSSIIDYRLTIASNKFPISDIRLPPRSCYRLSIVTTESLPITVSSITSITSYSV